MPQTVLLMLNIILDLLSKDKQVFFMESLLISYSSWGITNAVDLLIQKGVNVCKKALHNAISNGHVSIIKALLSAGANQAILDEKLASGFISDKVTIELLRAGGTHSASELHKLSYSRRGGLALKSDDQNMLIKFAENDVEKHLIQYLEWETIVNMKKLIMEISTGVKFYSKDLDRKVKCIRYIVIVFRTYKPLLKPENRLEEILEILATDEAELEG
jgi:hypothetical protein